MKLEDPFDTNLCTLMFIILSGVVALGSGLIVKKIASEEELGNWCEYRSEDRDVVKMQLPYCEVS